VDHSQGSNAVKAAGEIHSDIEKEVIPGGSGALRGPACRPKHRSAKKGAVRLEGKEYIGQEGDVSLFRHRMN